MEISWEWHRITCTYVTLAQMIGDGMETISDTTFYGSLNEALRVTGGEEVRVIERRAVHGGDANDSYKLILSNGSALFIKTNSLEKADFFRAESEGIAAIETTGTLRVPHIHAVGTDNDHSFLLMEYIDSARPERDFWEKLGTGLARMHQADTSPFVKKGKYGLDKDNYIGAGSQKNAAKDSWTRFFAECRLRPQFELASRYFDRDFIRKIERLLEKLDRYLIEPEKPALLHGDLWSGNFMSDEIGQPMLIDPAVYVGCNEADIAMTELFGGFDRRFYDSYFELMGDVPGYEDRRDFYNLYHLLNHLNLFGSSYLYAVVRIVEKYSG